MTKGGYGESGDFDLEERTALFGEAVIAFALRVPSNRVTDPLVSQVVRCGTSVGGNYCEADEAETGKEFNYRISLCKRECKETRFQIRMICAAAPEMRDAGRKLWQESKELSRIFAAILRKRRGGN
jgi:four helix bundle protein